MSNNNTDNDIRPDTDTDTEAPIPLDRETICVWLESLEQRVPDFQITEQVLDRVGMIRIYGPATFLQASFKELCSTNSYKDMFGDRDPCTGFAYPREDVWNTEFRKYMATIMNRMICHGPKIDSDIYSAPEVV